MFVKRHFLITVGGQTFEVSVEEMEAPGSVPGRTTIESIPPVGPSKAGVVTAGTPGGQAKAIRAPMAGAILSLFVQEGDGVKRGQRLLVLEAMKMENNILAPRDGKIERVLVQVGQSVNTGEELLLIS